jgi:hypothetical protein
MTFRAGQSGNPAGRRPGARNKVLLALDIIGAEAAKDVLDAAIVAARDGDMTAAGLILSRVWPSRKGRPIPVRLPALTGKAADIVASTAAIVESVGVGELTIEEGEALIAIVDRHRKAIETADLEKRIEALEGREKGDGQTQ